MSNYCYLYLRTSLELAQDSVTFKSGFPQDVDFHGLINQQRAFDPNAGCSSLVCVVFCLLCRYSRLFITVSLDSLEQCNALSVQLHWNFPWRVRNKINKNFLLIGLNSVNVVELAKFIDQSTLFIICVSSVCAVL